MITITTTIKNKNKNKKENFILIKKSILFFWYPFTNLKSVNYSREICKSIFQ